MRVKSWTGAVLGLAYALGFAAAYALYRQRAGEWFADLPVVTVSAPYLYVAREVSGGSYSFSGDMTIEVIKAALFGAALAYLIGWAIEAAVRGLWRAARRPSSST